jgi:hypothetical protein
MAAYAMINDRSLEDFRTQLAVGVKRPQLARDAFTPQPAGAFDAMPPELSSSVRKGLDALSRDSQRMVRDYLHKRLGRDRDLDDDDQAGDADVGNPGIGSKFAIFSAIATSLPRSSTGSRRCSVPVAASPETRSTPWVRRIQVRSLQNFEDLPAGEAIKGCCHLLVAPRRLTDTLLSAT